MTAPRAATTIYFDPGLHRKLKQHALELGVSLSALQNRYALEGLLRDQLAAGVEAIAPDLPAALRRIREQIARDD